MRKYWHYIINKQQEMIFQFYSNDYSKNIETINKLEIALINLKKKFVKQKPKIIIVNRRKKIEKIKQIENIEIELEKCLTNIKYLYEIDSKIRYKHNWYDLVPKLNVIAGKF